MGYSRLCFLALAAAVLFIPPVQAQDSLRIIAVVNEDAITMLDLKTRMCITPIASRLEDTPEARLRMGPIVLRKMIDEQIRLQEAARRGITVPESAIDERLLQLTDGMDRHQLETRLDERGISAEVLRHMARVELVPQISEDERKRAFIDVRSNIDYANLGTCGPKP